MRQRSFARVVSLSTILLAGAAAGPSAQASVGPSPTDSDPITVGILVGLGTGLAVSLVYDQSTSVFLSTAFGYAKPIPDANRGWYLGRGEAMGADYDPATDRMPRSFGCASAEVNWILPDSLDAKRNSYGAYHNVARTFKNGALRNAQSGGQADPNDPVSKINIDITGFTTNEGRMRIALTGGTNGSSDGAGSLNAVYVMGAEFNEANSLWVPWLPNASAETDAAVAAHYGEHIEGTASISDIASAALGLGCLNFSSMLADRLNGATTVGGGQMTVGDIHFVCNLTGGPTDQTLSSALTWWQSVQAEANADAFIPAPGAASLLGFAAASTGRRRRTN